MRKTCNIILGLVLIFAFLFPQFIQAQAKQELNTSRELIADKNVTSIIQAGNRIDAVSGMPLVLYRPNYQVNPGTPEQMAKQFLLENANLLMHKSDLSDIVLTKVTKAKSGVRVQFVQQAESLPVYASSIKISIAGDYA